MASALVGLGSNLGDRTATLDHAIQLLGAAEQVRVVKRSRWIGTRPIGQAEGAPEFLNGAALLETILPPEVLLVQLHSIEKQLGRQRNDRCSRKLTGQQLELSLPILLLPRVRYPRPRDNITEGAQLRWFWQLGKA